MRIPVSLALIFCLCSISPAQLPTGWRQHDFDRPAPVIVTPGDFDPSGNAGPTVPAPSDAIVLFDGTDLSAWRSADGGDAKWVLVDGVMESVSNAGYVFTRETFGDCQLHIEWSSPQKVVGNGQGRGNSGVYLMGKYEVQVLDSFDNPTYADGSAASIYGQFPPLVNASRGPGQWQSYDIVFRRPRFDPHGNVVSLPRITVLHNGIVVQDATEPFAPTSWLVPGRFDHHADQLPLSLQDHGNPVRYRNIWIRRLDENPRPAPVQPYETATIQLSTDEIDKLVGRFGNQQFTRAGRTLQVSFGGSTQDLIAINPTTFHARITAATFVFELGEDGVAKSVTREFGGDTSTSNRE